MKAKLIKLICPDCGVYMFYENERDRTEEVRDEFGNVIKEGRITGTYLFCSLATCKNNGKKFKAPIIELEEV